MDSLLTSTAPSLSRNLRVHTAALHGELEAMLGLPGRIRTQEDYRLLLVGFLGFYAPLERALAAYAEWEAFGLPLAERNKTASLVADLKALGVNPAAVRLAAAEHLPRLPTFAHALGALYVIEGATLGGRVILRDLAARVGPEIDGATGFFGGRGETVGPMWQEFRRALENFARLRPGDTTNVLEGAEQAFSAMLTWFAGTCAFTAAVPAGDAP
jgi:heme oxygenase